MQYLAGKKFNQRAKLKQIPELRFDDPDAETSITQAARERILWHRAPKYSNG